MKEHKPIKRHSALISYSKEHHFGLLLTWKIRQGFSLGVETERMSKYVLHFFNTGLKKHFADEETFLFSRIAADDALRRQAEAEHREIYSLVAQIASNLGDDTLLRSFADLLEKHIRFEERNLFNHLQQHIPADELEAIEKRTNAGPDPDLQWPDAFWLKK